jgi:hypothetical protein
MFHNLDWPALTGIVVVMTGGITLVNWIIANIFEKRLALFRQENDNRYLLKTDLAGHLSQWKENNLDETYVRQD